MKISEIKVEYLISYCNAYDDEETKKNMGIILDASKAFIKSSTGLDDETIDTYEDLTLVLLAVVSDMYDNRTFTIEKVQINPIYDSILNMHRRNFL